MEYLISFSSFYKAAYAEEKLHESGVSASLRKLPAELLNSCSTGLYLRTDAPERIKKIFESAGIYPRGVYRIERKSDGTKRFNRIV